MKRNRYQGFTLIEMLVVLFVVSLFISLPALAISEMKETFEVQQFYRQLERQLLKYQQLALYSKKNSRVSNKITYVSFSNDELVERLYLPKCLKSSLYSFKFTNNLGNTSPPGAELHFDWQKRKQRVQYQFLFGKGHYEKKVGKL